MRLFEPSGPQPAAEARFAYSADCNPHFLNPVSQTGAAMPGGGLSLGHSPLAANSPTSVISPTTALNRVFHFNFFT